MNMPNRIFIDSSEFSGIKVGAALEELSIFLKIHAELYIKYLI